MDPGRLGRRGGVALCAVAAACAGAPAGASAGGNPLGLEAEIVETSQSRILADDALKLRVSADTSVDASLRVRTTGGKPLAKRLEVRAKPNPKVHKLPLTQRGANRLARCKPRELEASATAIFEGDIIIRTEDRRALVTDLPACEPPPTRAYDIEPGGRDAYEWNPPRPDCDNARQQQGSPGPLRLRQHL